MIIFDKPFVSDVIASYAAESKTPVLDNDFARDVARHFDLNLLAEKPFAEAVAAGQRLYTLSENALDWVYAHVHNRALLDGTRLMKDKYAFRSALKPMYPDYFFRRVPASQLHNVDLSELPLPFILKPAVGFYSVGVYSILQKEDWFAALDDIEANIAAWKKDYPASVFADSDFLLEAFIKGEEYAVDVFFDDNGNAVIVNIMKHDFSSAKDVSDRLYYTSAEIIRAWQEPFSSYFTDMNRHIGVKNYPAHIEIRIGDDGTTIPIEYNSMRFAGWCVTDLAWYAYGLRTYEYYLENHIPDWDKLLAGKEGQIFSMIILDKPSGGLPQHARFDYDAVCATFSKVLQLRRMEKPEHPMLGFLFTQTPAENRTELDRIMRSDLTEYLVSS